MPLQLHANPEFIRDIFREEYRLPNFQRPYSWDEHQCQKLVEDLVDFYDSGDADPYFLGSLVVAKELDAKQRAVRVVIDGQQRLTTLSLLIKALYNRAETYGALKDCLFKKDKKTGEFLKETRLTSKVLEDDKYSLDKIILGDASALPVKNKFRKNFLCLEHALKVNDEVIHSRGGLEGFVDTLLDRVMLLPIVCEDAASGDSAQSALRIFRTLNTRGMPLDDADIFKADLYNNLKPEEQNRFIEDWNALRTNGEYIALLFRIHMHVLRAHSGDIGKEKALRSFFETGTHFYAPLTLIGRLQKYHAIFGDWGTHSVNMWWSILDTTPNEYWRYPLFVFLDKHGDCNEDGLFSLPEEKTKEFVALLENTARYFFIKGVATNSINSVKDTVYKVCAAIAEGDDYAEPYRKNAEVSLGIFLERLDAGDYGRYQKALVLTGSALHLGADIKDYAQFLLKGGYHIEHILPQKWNDYDGWDDQTHERDINKLGNLIPFERRLNIRASNAFFSRKQKEYKKSSLAEVKGLRDIQKWTPETLAERHEKVLNRLREFFQSGFEN